MSASVTTLLAAIVAVLGTLTSPLLTQRLTAQARLQEIEAARRQRLDDREEEQRRASFLDRRTSYTALHTAAWDFRRALKNCLFDGSLTEELEVARQAFLTNYRDSQMISTDAVLRAADPVYDALTDVYGTVKKVISTAPAAPLSSIDDDNDRSAIRTVLNSDVEHVIRHLRTVMRTDLGVSDGRSDTDAMAV